MRTRKTAVAAEVTAESRKGSGALPVPRGVPAKLPPRRPTTTYGPKIVGPDGQHRVHVALGREREGGEVVEVWVDVVHREGAPLRGFAHALARVASQALQHGMPYPVLVRSLLGTDGGPEGAVVDCEGISEATSIPDLVGRVLALAGGTS